MSGKEQKETIIFCRKLSFFCLSCPKKNWLKTEHFLYFLNIFKSNVQIKPNAPKTINMIGSILSSFTSSLYSDKYHNPKSKTNSEIITLITKNKFECFFSNSSKYGFVLKALSSTPMCIIAQKRRSYNTSYLLHITSYFPKIPQ